MNQPNPATESVEQPPTHCPHNLHGLEACAECGRYYATHDEDAESDEQPQAPQRPKRWLQPAQLASWLKKVDDPDWIHHRYRDSKDNAMASAIRDLRNVMKERDDLEAELSAALKQKRETCDVCTGTGKLLTGITCKICSGTGDGYEEKAGLRKECFTLEAERDRLREALHKAEFLIATGDWLAVKARLRAALTPPPTKEKA